MSNTATNTKPAKSFNEFDQKESKEMLRAAEKEVSQAHPQAPGLGMGSVRVGPRRPDEDDEGGEGGGGVPLLPHPAFENTPEGADTNISARADQNTDVPDQLDQRKDQESPELQMQLANEKKLTNTKTAKPSAAPTLRR